MIFFVRPLFTYSIRARKSRAGPRVIAVYKREGGYFSVLRNDKTVNAGDIFIAFSTANTNAFQRASSSEITQLPNDLINPIFEATVQATEEAIINAMIAAETMEGINGNTIYALPHAKVISILKKYNRIATPVTAPLLKKKRK